MRLGVRVSDTSARIQAGDTEIDAGEHPGREPKRCGLGVAGYRNLFRKVRDDQALEIRGDVVRHAAFYSGNRCCRSGPMGSPTVAYEERKHIYQNMSCLILIYIEFRQAQVVANPNARVSEFRH